MSEKLIMVKLTAAQWKIITAAAYEWGELTMCEAEAPDGSIPRFNRPMFKRGEAIKNLSTEISEQVMNGGQRGGKNE